MGEKTSSIASASRRRFLRIGSDRDGRAPIRPPWAADESRFPAQCTRCGDCIRTCPQGLLRAGDGGYPEADFRAAGCTFCGLCATACRTGALARRAGASAWEHRVSIGPACLAGLRVECRVCAERCEHGALRMRPAVGGVACPELDPDRCTGCGACVHACPVGAIRVQPLGEHPA